MHIIKNVILMDQLSKLVAFSVLRGISVIIPGFISFIKVVKNEGVSFGLLSGMPADYLYLLKFIILAIIVGLIIYYNINRTRFKMLHRISLEMIIGGAVSNLLDRVLYGAVADFISFSFFGINMFVCNIADVFLTIGGIIFVLTAGNAMKAKKDKYKDILETEDGF